MTASFVTVDELSIYLGHGPLATAGLLEAAREQMALLIRFVSADVQTATGKKIAAGSGTHRLPGTYSQDLELPQTPVVSITSVTLDGVALGAGDYDHNDRALLRRGSTFAGDAIGTGWGTHWGGPTSTVWVSYSWGTETIPDFVKGIVCRACARVLPSMGSVAQESLGSYSVTYANVTADGSHITTAERRLLRRSLSRTAGSFPVRGLG